MLTPVLADDLQDFLTGLEADSSLVELMQLRERLDALDHLDRRFGELDSEASGEETNGRIHHRAKAIRTRLEAVNQELYRAIRSEIMHGAQPHALARTKRMVTRSSGSFATITGESGRSAAQLFSLSPSK